ncbi:MAG: serine/threonine protein kinase [Anaerolineae bacterium]|nr:serine/threonine protein kinase [Anaerolineae bacterium]
MSEFAGRNLGPYRVIEQLGIGGMATVYKAYQPNMDRHVAIKILPRHFATDPTFVGRFEQEAKVIAKLENARILPVYDYGEDGGVTYIVMRYLATGTLAERLQTGTLSLEEIVRITGQIAEGLDYAHRQGVIHRDVKPSNILLDQGGDVYITDFGISKLVEGTAQFTGSGIVGTPAYISPEQGLGQPVDHRTDIYSLGVVLYQMATNDVPFRAETPLAVVIKHIHEPLPLPRSINPALPEAVERVILKAMAKDPEARYQSCEEMAAALKRAVEQADSEMSASRTLPDGPPPARPAEALEYRGKMLATPLHSASEIKAVEARAPKQRGCLIPAGVAGGLTAACLVGLGLMAVAGFCPPAGPWPLPSWCQASAELKKTPLPQLPGATLGEKPSTADAIPAEAASEALFDDDFAMTIKEDWQGFNNPHECWYVQENRLMFTVVPGTTIAEPGQDELAAPMLVFPLPDTLRGFSAQATLVFAPRQNYRGAGLIVLNERRQPMFSLTRSYCDKPDVCQGDALYLDNWLKSAESVDYRPMVTGGGQLLPITKLTLRLDVRPGIVMGYVKLDDGEWRPAGEWPVTSLRVGYIGLVTTAGGQQDIELGDAEFDDFMVLPIDR